MIGYKNRTKQKDRGVSQRSARISKQIAEADGDEALRSSLLQRMNAGGGSGGGSVGGSSGRVTRFSEDWEEKRVEPGAEDQGDADDNGSACEEPAESSSQANVARALAERHQRRNRSEDMDYFEMSGRALWGDEREEIDGEDFRPTSSRSINKRSAITLDSDNAKKINTDSISKLAAGRAISYFNKTEKKAAANVEKDSIYGAVVAVPQIARSAGWPWTLIAMTVRIYLFLFLNVALQVFLLSMLGEEQLIMQPFKGKVHLCNFGSNIEYCPEGHDCVGPGGTIFAYPRLWEFGIWNLRKFVHSSLVELFPHMSDGITQAADPGEYGVENTYIRMVCIFMFIMGVTEDLAKTLNFVSLLFTIPTEPGLWLGCSSMSRKDRDSLKHMLGSTELDSVSFRVAGMPLHWKAINLIFVVVPKLLLWIALVPAGVHKLMETARIVDVIVSAMALTFVLDIDEMLFAQLTTAVTRHMMESMQPYIDSSQEDTLESDDTVLQWMEGEETGVRNWRKLRVLIPWRLLKVLLLQGFFVARYYSMNCIQTEDGSWVSVDVYRPETTGRNFLQLMFGMLPPPEGRPFWTMPETPS